MQNVLLKISYDGGEYSGWQSQKKARTVESEIEKCLHQVLDQPVVLTASGRTDAGVSAICQYANFKTSKVINPLRFAGRLNSLLPSNIRILSCSFCDNDFNARYSAKSKVYAYSFYLGNISVPFYNKFATHFKQNVNMQIFARNLKMLQGEHNFSSFCATNNQTVNKVRTIYSIELIKNNDVYTVKICGNGFLYNMIRILVGTLIDISCGKIKYDVLQVLKFNDRKKAGFTAPANGLVLLDVQY